MRSSSSSSSVTVQPLPSPLDCSKPETASTGLPNSSSIWSRARPTSSGSDKLFFDSAMEPVEELPLQRFVGFLVDLAALESGLGLCELGADPGRIVQLGLGLLDDLLEHPGEPTYGRKGKREQAADQSHQATTGMASRTKLYGGSGPTSLKWIGGDSRATSSSSRASILSTRSRSTSKARSNTANSPAGSPMATSRTRGRSSSRTRDWSCTRRSASLSPTASPSAMPTSTDGSAR